MGLLDNVLKQTGMGNLGALGSLASLAASNPGLLSAVTGLLNQKGTAGIPGGLGGLLSAFSSHGLGDVVSSWISTGQNQPIEPSQLAHVLGPDVLSQFAAKAGIQPAEASSVLARLLPQVVDHLTPNGQVPEANALEGALGGLLSALGR